MDNIATLAVTNPKPQNAEWIARRTGMTKAQANYSHRIHTNYQAVGRTSIRNKERERRPKRFLYVARKDAWEAHENQFIGSKWLGQVGELPPIADLQQAGGLGSKVGTYVAAIDAFMEGRSEPITSGGLKLEVARACPPRTWARAVEGLGAAGRVEVGGIHPCPEVRRLLRVPR